MEAADVKARWPLPGVRDDKYSQGSPESWPLVDVSRRGDLVHRCRGGDDIGYEALRGVRCGRGRLALAGGGGRAQSARRRTGAILGRRTGLGTDEKGFAALHFALSFRSSVVVDADALTILSTQPDLVAGGRRRRC